MLGMSPYDGAVLASDRSQIHYRLRNGSSTTARQGTVADVTGAGAMARGASERDAGLGVHLRQRGLRAAWWRPHLAASWPSEAGGDPGEIRLGPPTISQCRLGLSQVKAPVGKIRWYMQFVHEMIGSCSVTALGKVSLRRKDAYGLPSVVDLHDTEPVRSR